MTFDALPPHDVQAEESVIASLMLDPDAPAKVAPIVSAGDFFREANAWTYEACLALWERGASVRILAFIRTIKSDKIRSLTRTVRPYASRSDNVLNAPVAWPSVRVSACAVRSPQGRFASPGLSEGDAA